MTIARTAVVFQFYKLNQANLKKMVYYFLSQFELIELSGRAQAKIIF